MNKEIYCFEVQTDHGRCRLTLPKEEYNILLLLKTEYEKLKYLKEYYSSLGGDLRASKFIRQFITRNEEIMIGNLDGTESEF